MYIPISTVQKCAGENKFKTAAQPEPDDGGPHNIIHFYLFIAKTAYFEWKQIKHSLLNKK